MLAAGVHVLNNVSCLCQVTHPPPLSPQRLHLCSFSFLLPTRWGPVKRSAVQSGIELLKRPKSKLLNLTISLFFKFQTFGWFHTACFPLRYTWVQRSYWPSFIKRVCATAVGVLHSFPCTDLHLSIWTWVRPNLTPGLSSSLKTAYRVS